MRTWRIHSYLNTCEDTAEEGMNQPVGPDAFDEPPPSHQPAVTEGSVPRFGVKEAPNIPPKPRPDILTPRFGKPKLPESSNKDLHPFLSDLRHSALEKKDRELDKQKERDTERGGVREEGDAVEVNEAPDLFVSRHESFRSRINPLLQRSSRLRSSLIFSSSKAEMHSGSLGLKPATEEDEELDSVRTSSIVTQILEKRRPQKSFEWRQKAEEKDKEKEEKVKEKQQEEKAVQLTDEIKSNQEVLSTNTEEKTTQSVEKSQVTTAVNMNDPASRLQYFKELAAKRKVSKIDTELLLKDSAEKKPDLTDKASLNPTSTSMIPDLTVSSKESEPKKPDISAKLAELARRPSISSSKPPIITAKPFVSSRRLSETVQPDKEATAPEGQKKDIFKSLKPLPSPKIFKKDQFKFKGPSSRRISSGEEILIKDATDAEKSELRKIRSHSSSALSHEDSKEVRMKVMGSNTSINTIGEAKGEGKTLDFLKKQTQRLKGFLGPKDKEKKASGDDRGMTKVIEVTGESSQKPSSSGTTAADQPTTNHKTSAGTSVSSKYQSPGSSVLFSSNLRDDTKVILEQISANSQKNRQEREEAGGDKDITATEKGLETQNPFKKNRLLRPQGNTLEREGLLKRIESLRKEKKVYSRFEVIEVGSIVGKEI